MKRITPEMCLAAYEKTGAKPAMRTYMARRDGITSCCGLGALRIAAGEYDDEITTLQWGRDNFGSYYASGFVEGFDQEPAARTNEEYMAGYADGLAAAEAVFRPTQTLGATDPQTQEAS